MPKNVGQWYHVGLNLGAPVELYVDGVLATYSAQLNCDNNIIKCNSTGTADIQGNNNYWVVGASNGKATEGTLDQVIQQLHGAVDSVQLSSVRRNFAGP